MNYEFNLLPHAGVVGKRLRVAAAAAEKSAAHAGGGGGTYHFGPSGPRGKTLWYPWFI